MNDALKNAKHASLATIRDVIKSVDGNVTSDAARYNDKLAHAHAARAERDLAKARSPSHWFPYDPVGVVNAVS